MIAAPLTRSTGMHEFASGGLDWKALNFELTLGHKGGVREVEGGVSPWTLAMVHLL